MSDLISSTLSISPSRVAGLGSITPLAFQQLTPGPATAVSSTVNRSSVLVQLSSSGQLLSAVSTFRNRLESLQTSSSEVSSQAQTLVDAFNDLQSSVGRLQTSFGALTGSSTVDSFALTLNQLAGSAIATGSASLASLPAIGIELETVVSTTTGATSFALRLDQAALAAAQEADPGGTQALLRQATQAFVQPLVEFEAQVASAVTVQTNLTQLGTSISGQAFDLSSITGLNAGSTLQDIGGSIDLLPLLSADAVLNNLGLAELDLASLGLGAGLVTPTVTPEETLLAATALPLTAAANPEAIAAAAEPDVAAVPLPTASSSAVATAATPLAVTASDAAVAERAAAEATLALQNFLNNPALRAISNNRFDPAYAAVVAAAHLPDFVLPTPQNNPDSLVADRPAPVSSAAMVRALGDYSEAAMGYPGAYAHP